MMTFGERKFDAIVCLSQIDWDFLWQRTQEIMSQFAAMGYPVLFIENTGVRNVRPEDIPRIIKRLKNILKNLLKNLSRTAGRNAENKNSKNITVISPFVFPFPYSRFFTRLNGILLYRHVQRFCKAQNIPINRTLMWTYMTTPLAVNLAEKNIWSGIVVDLVSDPCKVKGAEKLNKSHERMLKLADTVFCASKPVLDITGKQLGAGQEKKLYLLEDGFSTGLPELIKQRPKDSKFPWDNYEGKIVGYIGGINEKISWEAISAMARAFPDILFVMAGPKEFDELPCKEKNVLWHPQFEDYNQLGHFLQRCSVGLIPYVNTEYVSEMRPAKINEYLVMGLPIVGTRMPELDRLSNQLGLGTLYLAEERVGFISALKQALNEDNKKLRVKRRQFVKGRSWSNVCEEALDQIEYSRFEGSIE